MVEVSVQLDADVAAALQGATADPRAEAVAAAVRTEGAELQPVHPRHADPGLRAWHRIEVPEEPAAERLARELMRLDGVEAAFVKAPPAMP